MRTLLFILFYKTFPSPSLRLEPKELKVHLGEGNFIANALSAIATYCFFEKKPAIDVSFTSDRQLALF